MNNFINNLTSKPHKVDFPATLQDKGGNGYIVFTNSGITFHKNISFTNQSPLFLPKDKISSVQIADLTSTSSRTTITRLALMRWWAFAFPKKETTESCQIDITLNNGKFYSFIINGFSGAIVKTRTSELIHSYINN